MNLTKSIKDKIKRSLLIKPELKDSIINQWRSLSEGQKRTIFQLVETSEEAQGELLRRACSNDPSFETNLKYHIKKQGIRKQKRKEAVHRKQEGANLSNISKEMDDIFDADK